MCFMMGIVTAKTDYIIKTKNTLINLKNFEESFSDETKVIWRAKCLLMQNEELDDYYVDGIYVSVYRTSSGYNLKYMGYNVDLTVYDKQIIDYTIEK